MSAAILVVEDDSAFSELLATILNSAGYTVSTASNGFEAHKIIERSIFDIVISDLKMPVMGGIELFEATKEIENRPLFIFITAFGKVDEAVSLMKQGAFDFLTKPLESPAALLEIVKRAMDEVRLKKISISFRELEENSLPPKEIIFLGEKMKSVEKLVADVAKSNATVLLTGESGTGKEVIARVIHLANDRKREPFVALNCAAIPENLLESELFGHEKGSFTGAMNSRRGKFELAQKGTIFLDEIGEMPLHLQSKLLRVLQEKRFERVGGSSEIKVDVRVIAATNRNLAQEVTEKRFREDLYYRLNVFPIKLPPLKERRDAIKDIIQYVISYFAAHRSGRKNIRLEPESLELLEKYEWKGNIRELKNVIERALIIADKTIEPKHLPDEIRVTEKENIDIDIKSGEKGLILEALSRFSGNRKSAAEALGISLRTLQYRIKELGISKRIG